MPHPLTSLSIPPSFPPLISPLWRPLLSLPITTLFPPSPYLPRLSPPRSFNPSICFVCPSIRLSPLQTLLFRMCRLNTWHGVLKSVHVCVCVSVCECVCEAERLSSHTESVYFRHRVGHQSFCQTIDEVFTVSQLFLNKIWSPVRKCDTD